MGLASALAAQQGGAAPPAQQVPQHQQQQQMPPATGQGWLGAGTPPGGAPYGKHRCHGGQLPARLTECIHTCDQG